MVAEWTSDWGPLPTAGIPDRSRRFVIAAFAPHQLRSTQVVDGNREVIAKWKAEAFGQNVVVATHRAGELPLRRPRRSTVTRTALENIPHRLVWQRMVPRVHPRDAHAPPRPRRNRRETVLGQGARRGNVHLARPAC